LKAANSVPNPARPAAALRLLLPPDNGSLAALGASLSLVPGQGRFYFFGSVWKYRIVLGTDTSARSPGVPAGPGSPWHIPAFTRGRGAKAAAGV